jgi:uncharacterized membrane protein
MPLSHLLLATAALLCALTAGLVFAFAVVVMPGIRALPDRDYLRAFQGMDRVIQQNDPRFLVVWAGSVVTLLAAVPLNVGSLSGAGAFLLIGAAAAYLLCVQLPTAVVNVPLNNRLQTLDLDSLDAGALRAERDAFESRWVYWNTVRTAFACVSTAALLILLLML